MLHRHDVERSATNRLPMANRRAQARGLPGSFRADVDICHPGLVKVPPGASGSSYTRQAGEHGPSALSERQLRDIVVANLDVLEPGLTLVATEYRLPNAIGSGGRVDILAKDVFGHFVVIEIKRSNTAAREAIHELYTYLELLRAERGLRPVDLRCMLISTTWTGLMRPFSGFVRFSEYDCAGFMPVFDTNGHLIRFSQIEALPAPILHGLTGEQELLLFSDPSDRDAAFDSLAATLAEVGCPDIVGVCLDHPLPPPAFGFPYMLYLTLGQMDETDPATAVLENYDDESGSPWELESRASYYAYEKTSGKIGLRDLDEGWPERFASLLLPDSRWKIVAIRRSGVFQQQHDLVSDDELIEQIGGRVASNETSYDRRVSPLIVPSWLDFRTEFEKFLSGVPAWQAGMRWWLDEIEAEHTEHVVVQAFCPNNLPRSLVEGVELGQMLKRLPSLGAATYLDRRGGSPGDRSEHRLLFGELMWDGSEAVTLLEAFEHTYKDPLIWALFQNNEAELQFLDLLGLKYVLLEKDPAGRRTLLIRDGDGFRRQMHDDIEFVGGGVRLIWKDAYRMDTFVERRAEEIQQLAQHLFRHRIN